MIDLQDSAVAPLGVWTHSGIGPTTSFVFEVAETRILIDTGIDPIGQLRKAGIHPGTITALFVSHVHSDHSSGLSNFIFTRELLRREEGEPSASLRVLGNSETLNALRTNLRNTYPNRDFNVSWQYVRPAETVSIGPACLSFCESDHTVETTSLVISESGSGKAMIGFQADSRPLTQHAAFFADCELLIAQAFELGSDANQRAETNGRGHSTAFDAGALARAAGVRAVLPYHLPRRYREDARYRDTFLKLLQRSGSRVIDPTRDSRQSDA